jgi:TonB family protein
MLCYFLFANIYAVFFCSLYAFFLKGQRNHSWSRFYLLGSIIASIVLPLIKFKIDAGIATKPITTVQLQEFVLNNKQIPLLAPVYSLLSWNIFYLIIVCLLITQLAYRLISLKVFLNRQSFIDKDGIRLGLNTGLGPASFGNMIIFPENEADQTILKHEIAHFELKHYYDKLLLQVLRCFFFPIVGFHFMYKELMLVHEFETDEKAASEKDIYVKALLAGHLNTKQIPLLQNFFHHPLKRRIMMLHKNKTSGNGRKALLLSISAIALSTIIVLQSNTKAIAQDKKAQSNEKIYETVEVVPVFPGGADSLNKYLAENIHYPDAARESNVRGRVVIKFVIDKTGAVTDVEIKRNIKKGCGEEAKRVVMAMPKWTPGTQNGEPVSVLYYLPVTFALAK